MLDTTRAATFVPGSNRVGSDAGDGWLALLPSLAPRNVLVAGMPAGPVLRALARAAGSLTISCRTAGLARRVRSLAGSRDGVRVVAAADVGSGYDLVVAGRGAPAGDLRRALAPGGVLVTGHGARGAYGTVAVAPPVGEIAAAAPDAHPAARRVLEDRGLWTRRIVVRAAGRSREVGGPVARLLPERRIAVAAPAGPPAYIRRVAAEVGIDLAGHAWAMSAAGRYRSNKIVFFLLAPGAEQPAYVVKLTRDPSVNVRLDVERDALERLRASGAVPAGTIARVAFAGLEAGRAMLGLEAVAGRPFPAATRATADCPDAARAFHWLEDLGAATAFQTTGAELAGNLRELLARTLELYRLDARHRAVLDGSIEAIAGAGAFPAVFQHGDPGAWNLLVAEDGRVAFLDWEAAEPRGVPLWDTFHLARSYAVLAARKRGETDTLRGIDTEMLRETPINAVLGDVVARYRERIGIPPDLVEPLFHTSWMHRALKEATRLAPERLDDGHYVSLLRRGIDLRGTRALRRLLGRVTA